MKHIRQLMTPKFLVDLDKLEYNIKEIADLCAANSKALCPMVKTHKSTEIAGMQAAHGAAGFLVGTLDEAERLAEKGHGQITLAYPVAGVENIARVIRLAQKVDVLLSFDGKEAAVQWEQMLDAEALTLDYLVIVDSGLHRFGVQPDKVLSLAQELSQFSHLTFRGIATHPGHVYARSTLAEIEAVGKEEVAALEKATELLSKGGFKVDIVATGSTPTFSFVVSNKTITTLRPGNYTFYDAIQVALGVAHVERCSLTVLATVISNPSEGLFLIDAGSKCFGLDKGAHGVASVSGFGTVKDHPELVVEGLSEEVGRLRANSRTGLKVGDKINIIPNHACAAANMTSFLIGHRQGIVERLIAVDARGGLNAAVSLED